MPMNESARHVDLLKAFSQVACPVCRMLKRDMQKDMDMLMLERINKVETHYAFRAGRGLCNSHAWNIMQAKGGSLGIAVMYDSTMVELLKHAAQIKPSSAGIGRLFGNNSAGDSAAERLEPTGNCILCDSMNKSEDFYLVIIAENINDAQLQEAYHMSQGGVCLPHVRMVLRKLTQADDIRALMTLQTEKWNALQADLQLFIQANEDNVPQKDMGAEGDSWQRAIAYLSGDKDIFGYRR